MVNHFNYTNEEYDEKLWINDQPSLLEKYNYTQQDVDEHHQISISDTYKSIKTFGFTKGIHNIIAVPIKNSDYYVVLEGNRRISCLKYLKKEYNQITAESDRRPYIQKWISQ